MASLGRAPDLARSHTASGSLPACLGLAGGCKLNLARNGYVV